MSVTITGTPRARWAHCGGMHICNIGRIAQCGAFLARLIRIAIIWKRRTIYYLRRCRPKMGLIAWWKRSGLKWTFWPFRNSISKMPTMWRLKYAKKTFFFSGACNDVGWEQNIITIYGNARLWKRHIKKSLKNLAHNTCFRVRKKSIHKSALLRILRFCTVGLVHKLRSHFWMI